MGYAEIVETVRSYKKQRDILRFGKEGMPLCTKYQGYFFLVTKEENGISQNYSKMCSFKSELEVLKKRRQLSEEKWYSKSSKEVLQGYSIKMSNRDRE